MIIPHIYLVSFLISVIMIYELYKLRRSNIGFILIIMTVLTSFWIIMEGVSFYGTSSEAIVMYQKIKYVSIALMSPLIVITAYAFIWKIDKKSLLWLSSLFIIPVLTLISVATNVFPYPFISNADAYIENGMVMFIYDRNIGFTIHVIYSYLLILINSILLFYRFIKVPKIYKIQSFFVFFSTTVSMIINVFFVFGIVDNLKIDTTPFSLLLTILIYFWGVYSLPAKGIIPHARNLVIENISDIVVIVDNQNNIIDVNPKAYEVFSEGIRITNPTEAGKIDFRGMAFDNLIKSLPTVSNEIIDIKTIDQQFISVEIKKDIYYYQVKLDPIFDAINNQIGSLFIFYDITAIQKKVNELTLLNSDLNISDTIIREALEGIIITDRDNRIIKVNKSMEIISGFSASELMGKTPKLFKSGKHDQSFYKEMWKDLNENGFWEGEIWDRKKNNEVYPKWMSINIIKDRNNEITHFIGISSDISKMKKAEKDIHLMSYYDSLTGLPNRTLFSDRLKNALQRIDRSEKIVAVLYLDLGRFKLVNDTYGQHIGDELLIAFSARVLEVIKKSDTLSRLGGDEFTLILEQVDNSEQASKVARNIIREIEKPFIIQKNQISITLSIGIAIAPNDADNVEDLIRKSGAAMGQAKKISGSKYTFSSEELELHNQEINHLDIMLKKATEENEFELFLQPQIGRRANKLCLTGAEALIRWPQADGSMIPPDKFIGLAEKNGLIHPIGIWVLEEVFRINEKLLEADISIDLAINASIKQFDDDVFYGRIKELIHDDIALSVEITESLFFNDLTMAIEKLELIKALGIKIALDDFGTGFSSMSYLNRLPIDYLKIDKSFVDQIEANSNKNLAFMILSMAKSLELKTIAEGIEDREQADVIFAEGCDIIQGFYYGKPMPVSEFIKFAKDFEHN